MSKELKERLDRCNLNAIIFNQREALRTLEEDKATLKKQNKKIQEQLKEAREVVKFYAETTVGHKQKDGTYGMWVCSGEMAWENPLDRIKSRMDYICYDPRPAKKWLKKWGVK